MSRKPGNNAPDPPDDHVANYVKAWRKPDDLGGLRMRLYRAMRAAEVAIYHPHLEGTEDLLKAVRAFTQTAHAYLKVLREDEFEERLEALEEAVEQQPSTNGLRKVQ